MAAKRNVPYSTYLTLVQTNALGLLARSRGVPETVVVRDAIDAYLRQHARELQAILGLRAIIEQETAGKA